MENDSKEKALFKKTKKKIIIFAINFIIALLILFILAFNTFQVLSRKSSLENNVLEFAKNNEKVIFSIDKCTFFSSSDTKNKASSVTNFTIENLYQFTDMAFFINNHSDENTLENTLKSVKIANINFTKRPEIGEPALYYKNINNFAKSEIIDTNKIENELNYEVSSEDDLNFETPSIYNNCASPITLSYINSNIKNDYTFTDTSTPITYDGNLLKRTNVPLASIEASISFDIFITNNLDQQFKTTVFADIPLENSEKSVSIYDGKYTEKVENTSYIFYRY